MNLVTELSDIIYELHRVTMGIEIIAGRIKSSPFENDEEDYQKILNEIIGDCKAASQGLETAMGECYFCSGLEYNQRQY